MTLTKFLKPTKFILLFAGLLTISVIAACSTNRPTDTPDPATNQKNDTANARGAAVNQALEESGKVLGSVAVNSLFAIAQQEITGGKVDLAQAAAIGLWNSTDSILSSNAVGNVIQAYSAASLPKTAAAASNAFATATTSTPTAPPTVTNAIASVISAAAGAPPAPHTTAAAY